MPNDAERPRRVTVDREGPVLVEGPVEVVTDDGRTVRSGRFTVAICTCRRSRIHPWCDTSHRRRTASAGQRGGSGPGPSDAPSEGGRR